MVERRGLKAGRMRGAGKSHARGQRAQRGMGDWFRGAIFDSRYSIFDIRYSILDICYSLFGRREWEGEGGEEALDFRCSRREAGVGKGELISCIGFIGRNAT
jgi:hypothetical protein